MLTSHTYEWLEKQWPSRMFHDPRLHKRAVRVARAFLDFPDRSIPKRFSSTGDVKGCYRFLSRDDMGHEKLQTPHCENVYQEALKASGKVLFIQDGSEIIYNSHEWTMGLGPTADSCGSGIMFHSCLAVKHEGGLSHVIGLAGQKAWIRKENEKPEESEAEVWQEMIERIGLPPAKHVWIAVGDRANDIFSFVEALSSTNWDCVVRTKHDRKIRVADTEHKLKSYMRSLPSMCSYEHKIRARPGVTSRDVTLQISWVEAEMMPPQKEQGKNPVKGSYVRVWCEEDSSIEWILFTLSPVDSAEKACEIVSIYRQRWIIEEYHKCLKTGCKIEEAQLKTAGRLMTLFGLLGVIATQLLQLRDISRERPEEPAEEHVDKVIVRFLQKMYKLKDPLTVKEFWRRVAMLGGFLGRKSDGNPGWQTIWYGWLRLKDMLRGAELALQGGMVY
ncbi:MAG: IS4 family transposase [Rhabdochlamydiaceae bacterium]